MALQLGQTLQPDFDRPLDLMMDCHRRIEHFLGLLFKVVGATCGTALDGKHRQALQTSLDYFAEAAPRHTEDEEQSLFPRMRQSDDPRVRNALNAIESLETDHFQAKEAHARVDALGRCWLQDNRLSAEQLDALRQLLTGLQQTYASHIEVEDKQIFPLAGQVLNDAHLEAVGREMQHRRIINPGRPGSQCRERRVRTSPRSGVDE